MITQSNYLPWRGYFAMVASVDCLVHYDTAQFTRRDWRNRNRIMMGRSERWVTVPVRISGRYTQSIDETEIADPTWWRSHLSIFDAAYGNFAGYQEFRDSLHDLYGGLEGVTYLSQVNHRTLGWTFDLLGIAPNVFEARDLSHEGSATARVVQIAKRVGATTYVTGPAARAYLDEDCFDRAGIEVEYFDYSSLPFDPASTGPEGGELSVIDLLARHGSAAGDYVYGERLG